jgi:hypothetical protein
MSKSWFGTTRAIWALDAPTVEARNGKVVISAVSRRNSFDRSQLWLTLPQLDALASSIAEVRAGTVSSLGSVCKAT